MATFRERNGRYQAIVRHRNFSGSRTFDRLTDARSWARKKEREADLAASDIASAGDTIKELIEVYQQKVYPIKRWGPTKGWELDRLSKTIGNWRMPDLNKAKLLKYVLEEGLSPARAGQRLGYLREVFKGVSALVDKQLPIALMDDVISTAFRMKIAGKSVERTRRVTDDELRRLRAYLGSRERAFIDMVAVIDVLSVMPLRIGELCGIEWSDLMPANRAALLKSRKHPDVIVHEGNHQEIPFINFGGVDTWEILSGRAEYLPRPFPYLERSVSTAFHMACLELRIDDLHVHDLRAHAISNLLEAEIPIPQVAHLSGHRDWKVLARVYARLRAAKVQQSVDARAAAVLASPGTNSPGTGGAGRI